MSELDLTIAAALNAQVPLRLERRPAWDDVLARAGNARGVGPRRAEAVTRLRRPRRRILLALALVLVGVVLVGSALAAIGYDSFGGLGSWLDGSPGEPAPAAEQAGFAARNDASYASFPSQTRLRLLLQERIGGKTFSLLGFRSGSSLCLRLVRADQPAGLGANQCVTLRELKRAPAPALVASQAAFPSADSQTGVEGIFGFADDTVRAIELRRLHGSQRSVRSVNNVFVALRRAAFTRDGELTGSDPIVQVYAVTRGGQRARVPFAAITVPPPHVPSYFRGQAEIAAKLPGPATAEADAPASSISWLTSREPRGRPFRYPDPGGGLGKVLFSRSVRPDPDSPFRVGVTLTTGPARAGSGGLFRGEPVFMALKPHRLTLCVTEVSPFVPRGREGGSCGQTFTSGGFFPRGRPVVVSSASTDFSQGGLANSQITHLYGIAADGVREIDLYLASGRVVPAALRDNVYSVEAPTAQLPGKLVAYDARHRPVWVAIPPEADQPVLAACPKATQTTRPTPPKTYERLDLRTLRVNGRTIFGRTPSQVEAALGRPDFAQSGRDLGQRVTSFFYGGSPWKGQWRNAGLVIGFDWRPHGYRASTLWYEDPDLADAQLGRILRLQPPDLQRRIATAYGSVYHEDVGYGSNPGQYGCTGIYHSRQGHVEITFGLRPWLSARRGPYLTLRRLS